MSKFDKFKVVKEEHPENIYLISIAEEVLKLVKSKNIKSEQPENI